MLLGPIFELELSSAARKGRSYALRSAYGLALLALLVVASRAQFGAGTGMVSLPELARFARALFESLLLMQGVAVVFLTPALVSGAIAGEVQRKTLHDLLTSDLSSGEIVLGKLAARMLNVGVLVIAGLPILLLAGLFGGLDATIVLGAEAATLSTAFFLAALSILASTQTRSVRGALNFTLTLALTWLILPGAIEVLLPRKVSFGFELYQWFAPINAWIAPSSPFALWMDALKGTLRGPAALAARVAWMGILQLGYGAAMAGIAVACLRSSYRSREGRLRRRHAAKPVHRPRLRGGYRPSCGDDPMIWKELHASHPPAFYQTLGMLIALALGGLLAWTTFEFAAPAVRELAALGFHYGVAPSGTARALFHFYLRIVGTGIYLVYVLGVASDAAAGFAGEREKDTWVSLITTPLTGTEIVRAKILGSIWGIRHTAGVLVGLWTVGVVAGSVHPLGLLAAIVEVMAYTWFAAALGTWLSLRSERTMPAAARTISVLVLLNAGSLLVTLLLWPGRPLAFLGCTPFQLAASLVSYGDVEGHFSRSALGLFSDSALSALWARHGLETVLTCLAGVLGYAVAAWSLTRSACRGFDAMLDRPTVSAHVAGGRPSPPSFSGRRRAFLDAPRRWRRATMRAAAPAANGPAQRLSSVERD